VVGDDLAVRSAMLIDVIHHRSGGSGKSQLDALSGLFEDFLE
jgi:hypothetical protein